MLITQAEKFKSLKGNGDNLTKNIDLAFPHCNFQGVIITPLVGLI